MSEPRHAMLFECDDGHIWLNMVPEAEGDDDRSPAMSKTYGPFGSVYEARLYADKNFQNTGFVIPLYRRDRGFVDDRIDIHYVIDRLEAIQAEVRDCSRKDKLKELKREIIYNLGVNQRILYID